MKEEIVSQPAAGEDPVRIGHPNLQLEQIVAVAEDRAEAQIDREAQKQIEASAERLQALLARGGTIYGVNTGFGQLARVRIEPQHQRELARKLLRSHAAGVGEPLETREVRAMLLLRAHGLARGSSGVRLEVVERIVEMLRRRWHPVVPSRGSVGASGDLAPLAHLALPLIGLGEVDLPDGSRAAARQVLEAAGLAALELTPREGLALINGTQGMTALLALAVWDARKLVRQADLVGALAADALRSSDVAFDPRLQALRPHPGQARSAANLARLLEGSAIRESHRTGDERVQDPYSVRCMPQVHGAVREVLDAVERWLATEVNSVTDNPVLVEEPLEILSGGNFHGEPMAFAADFLAIALTELATISERRIEKLLTPHYSGLPAFLVPEPGRNSGFMMAQVTAASLLAELRILAHPASVDTVPTSAGQEDHVSMGMTAALKLREVVRKVRQVLGIELAVAAQGIDLLRPLRTSPWLETLHARVRERIPFWSEDREMAPVLQEADRLLADRDLESLVARLL